MNAPDTRFEARAAAAAAVLREEGAREVCVFGSAADGRATSRSDLDLAVVGLAPERFFKAMARARDAAGVPIDLVNLDDDSPFVLALRQYGGLRRVA
ncbi:MAG: nucleotidyltransferase domain-containing protein [Phycisphaerae bacterium]|nr:nucleotidyltransferase domain-containing protein [Phycisphaerae bacterium]